MPTGKSPEPGMGIYRLNTDGGIAADPPGQASGEAAIGVVLKAPLEEISETIRPVEDHHVACCGVSSTHQRP